MQHCLLIYHPLTYRSTCPAERSRMWEDTGRGRPFLSQLSCGGGEPVATHSMLTELSRTVINSSTVSPLPSITGGTGGADGERGQCCENKLKRQGEIQPGETVCILKCFKPTIDIQSEYPVLLSCTVGGYTSVFATVCGVSSSHREYAAIWTDSERKAALHSCSYDHNITEQSQTLHIKSHFVIIFWQVLLYLYPVLPVLVMTSPSFSHWMVGVGVPWTRQTSCRLSFSRTPISLGSSDPEILGGT